MRLCYRDVFSHQKQSFDDDDDFCVDEKNDDDRDEWDDFDERCFFLFLVFFVF